MRWIQVMLAGALLIAVAAQPARAQEEEEQKECSCVGPEAGLSEIFVYPRSADLARNLYAFGRRARLGVFVHSEANPETDRYGALIDGVAEDGPAYKAGIREGDVITKLDGESLVNGGEAYDEDLSAPGQRLIELARKLEVGDTVEVEYRRDGSTQTTELVAGDFDGVVELRVGSMGDSLNIRLQGLARRLRELPEVAISSHPNFAFALGSRMPGLELVELNPDLGEYFGTEEGVLVISAPEDSELGLEAGDVIRAIDGREVKSPSDAMRILRSYKEDEEVTFEIVRKKRERTVKGKVPEKFFGGVYGIRTRDP